MKEHEIILAIWTGCIAIVGGTYYGLIHLANHFFHFLK